MNQGHELISRLQHMDRLTRNRAFALVAASNDQELLAPLAALAQPQAPEFELLFCRYLGNLPARVTCPALLSLMRSPNPATRTQALLAFDTYDIEDRLPLMLEMLRGPAVDVQLYAIREFGRHRRSLAAEGLMALLSDSNRAVAEAAFAALEAIDAPRTHATVAAFLRAPEVWRQVLAIQTLTGMNSFRRWRWLLPLLAAADNGLRTAAVYALPIKAGPRANPPLMARLRIEPESHVAQLIVNRLALHPDLEVAGRLLAIAAAHADPQVRSTANWVVDEFRDELFLAAARRVLRGSSGDAIALVLVKLALRGHPESGALIQPFVRNQETRVRIAALEALGHLRRQEHLPLVTPAMTSPEPLEAYVATLAATQIVEEVSESPALVKLLETGDEGPLALKQVVLHHLADSASLPPADDWLIDSLIRNLDSGNSSIRYLSYRLLGRFRVARAAPRLLAAAMSDTDREGRLTASAALGKTLAGDLGLPLDKLADPALGPHDRQRLLPVLAELGSDAASAARLLALLRSDWVGELGGETEKLLKTIATAVHAAAPEAVRAYFTGAHPPGAWTNALGHAWLESLGEIDGSQSRRDWELMLAERDTALAGEAVRRAVDCQAAWAFGALRRRLRTSDAPDLTQELRTALRALSGF